MACQRVSSAPVRLLGVEFNPFGESVRLSGASSFDQNSKVFSNSGDHRTCIPRLAFDTEIRIPRFGGTESLRLRNLPSSHRPSRYRRNASRVGHPTQERTKRKSPNCHTKPQ